MLAVTGVGMVSPLGLDATTSCASARAGMLRIREIDDLLVDNAEGAETAPVAVHRVPLISAGFFGFGRLLQLSAGGLEDLQRSIGPQKDVRLGLVLLGGGESYRKAWLARARKDPEPLMEPQEIEEQEFDAKVAEDRIASSLLPSLLSRVGLAVSAKTCKAACATAVGFVSAIEQAEEWLAKGACDRCVIGGVDSLLDPTTLQALNLLGLLRTPQNPVGMIPGEAACFLLVEPPQQAARRGAAVQAIVEAPASAPGPTHPRMGEGAVKREALPAAITGTFARLADGGRGTGLAVVNLNGDDFRAAGWGDVTVTVRSPVDVGALPLWLPPLHFGEIGAATGPVSVALLARGWARGYAPARNALVCLMDDLGGRGTCYVRAKA